MSETGHHYSKWQHLLSPGTGIPCFTLLALTPPHSTTRDSNAGAIPEDYRKSSEVLDLREDG